MKNSRITLSKIKKWFSQSWKLYKKMFCQLNFYPNYFFFYFKLFITALAILVKAHFEKKKDYYLHEDVFGQFCMKKKDFLPNFCPISALSPPHSYFFLAKLPIVGWPMLLQIMWCKKCAIWIKTELIGLISVKLWDKRKIW